MFLSIRKNFKNISVGIATALFITLLYFGILAWLKKEMLEISQQDIFIKKVVNSINEDAIGASYQAYFVLGNKHQLEFHIPFNASSQRKVFAYVLVEHQGIGDLRKVDIFLDNNPVNVDISSAAFFSKKIDLGKYLKKSEDSGVYDFNEDFHIVSFRVDPIQKTDDKVIVKLLINVHGLSLDGGANE